MVQDDTSLLNKKFFGLKYDLNMQRVIDDDQLNKKVMEMTGMNKFISGKMARAPVYRHD